MAKNLLRPMRVLVVEDDPIAAEMLSRAINNFGYPTAIASDGVEALARVRSGEFRIVVSDVEMPRMDGIELCRQIRNGTSCGYTYFIMLTGRSSTDDIVNGLDAGADDYVAKPFNAGELKMRIRAGERLLLLESRELMIFALAKLADSRDNETGSHLERIREYCRVLCLELRGQPKFSEVIDGIYIQTIYETSPLHDIGKVGIPDSILLKPGKLTPEEFQVMTQHAEIGGRTLKTVASAHPKTLCLEMACQIAMTHHERWDGTGYPKGLKGEDIPLCGRIVAVADVYDALTSARCYKPAFSHEVAVNIITEGSGSQFDPDLVTAFQNVEHEFERIKNELAGTDEGVPPALLAPVEAMFTAAATAPG